MPVQRGGTHQIDKDAKLVDIELIKPVQVYISEKRLDNVRKGIKPTSKIQIHVIEIDGFYYISNGHHRAYAAQELGIKKMYIKEVRTKGNGIKRREDGCDHLTKLRVVSEKEFVDYLKKK